MQVIVHYENNKPVISYPLSDDADLEALAEIVVPEGLNYEIMEKADAEALIAPSPSDLVKAQILELESSISARRMREAVLGIDNGWLANVEAQIAALRLEL